MKKTPLYQHHVDSGANMADFGSYLMPLWYPGGAKNEHLTVIQGAGLFDTSHMAVVTLKGNGVRKLLQQTFTKNLESCLGANQTPLVKNRCVYGIFLDGDGCTIDDAIVYQVDTLDYMIVVNASMGPVIANHLKSHADSEVVIVDHSDELAKIDIQGPSSARILAKLLHSPEQVLQGMVYFSFKGWFDSSRDDDVVLLNKTPILLSRTGYTGEFGFEIFLRPEAVAQVWEDLLACGGESITPCGLAARDSLRAGSVLPLSHQDIGDWPFSNNPWPFALPIGEDNTFTKDFIGASALKSITDGEVTHCFAGFDPRKITPGENAQVLDGEGNHIGEILTCTTDMAIGRIEGKIISLATPVDSGRPEDFRPKGLSCGFVKLKKRYEIGSEIILTDGKRKVKVEIVADVRPDRTARKPMKDMIKE